MPSWRYSVTGLDPDKTAIASGRDLRIKPKTAREICNYIKGMKLAKAKETLQQVVELKKPVPYYRYKLKVPHRKEAQGFDAGNTHRKPLERSLGSDSVEATPGSRG
jgi:large subunit ribosomal protein L22